MSSCSCNISVLNLWGIDLAQGFIYPGSAAFGMSMESSSLVMTLAMQRTSWAVIGEAMSLQVATIYAYTTASRRFWNLIATIDILMLVWVLEFLNLIELPGMFVERGDPDTEHPIRVPPGFWDKPYKSTGTDDGTILEGNVVLVAP